MEELREVSKDDKIDILESISDAFFSLDDDLTITYFNEAAGQQLRKSAADAVGNKLFDVFPKMKGSEFDKKIHNVILSKKPVNFEVYLDVPPYQDWYDVRLFPRATGISVYFLITTERKLTEKKLEQSEQKFRTIIENSPDAIFIIDHIGNYIFANQIASDMLGYQVEELTQMNIRDLFLSEEGEKNSKLFQNLIKEGKIFTEINLLKKDKSIVTVNFNAVFLSDDLVYGSCRDITECKKIEQDLTESEQMFTLLGNFPGMAYRCKNNFDFTMLYVSQGCIELTGYKPEEIINCVNFSFGEILHPDDRKSIWESIQKGLEKDNYFELEYRILTKHRMTKWVLGKGLFVSTDKDGYKILEGFIIDITDRKNAEETIQQFNTELEQRVEKRTVELECARINAVNLMQDADLQRQTAEVISSELLKSEQELNKAKQIAESANRAKSEFLANMSHEIRTPMNAIIGISHLLEMTSLSDKQIDHVDKIKTATHSLLGIINDILDMSKIEAGQLKIDSIQFQLNQILEDLSNLISLKVQEKGLELIFAVSPNVPNQLIGDPLRLEQVLLNLTSNAIKFTQKGEIVISINLVDVVNHTVIIKFDIKDTGIGMSKAQIKKLFIPFGQTDTSITRKYGGTGLGLIICKNLVKMMGGDIQLVSKLGVGSTFSFTLEFEYKDSQRKPFKLPKKKMKELCVLIVDDNKTVCDVFACYLSSFSFNFKSVSSGQLAIDELHHSKQKIDLILIDWKMVGMDGITTAEKIMHDPEIHVKPAIILVTSYDQDKALFEAGNVGIKHVLVKPVTRSALFNTILDAMGEKIAYKRAKQKTKLINGLENIRGAKVLLVEDNKINQTIVIEMLLNEGIQLDVANNGMEAIQKIKKFQYDLVLMDLQMPKMDGYTVTKLIRKLKKVEKELPIVAMTADVIGDVREACKEVGMNDYLPKPFYPHELYKMLVKWISKKRVYKEDKIGGESKGKTLQEILNASKFGSMLSDLPGIDLNDGLMRVNYNVTLYRDILNQFRDNNMYVESNIQKAINNEDWKLAKHLVHKLKGVAGQLGMKILINSANLLDEALKKNDKTIIKSLFSDLSKNLQLVLEGLEQLLDSNIKAATSNVKLTKQELEKKLIELNGLIEQSDTRAVKVFDEIKDTLLKYINSGIVDTITKLLENYNFNGVGAILNQINLDNE